MQPPQRDRNVDASVEVPDDGLEFLLRRSIAEKRKQLELLERREEGNDGEE
jgi:hypothetical protein